MDKIAIKDAATIILIRDRDTNPRILMGQRGSKAAFMPNKYVFPGGAIDDADHDVPLGAPLDDLTSLRLAEESARPPSAIAIAAIRELHEETGQILGSPAPWPTPPIGWETFAQLGLRPDASNLQFIFRAITPAGAPRRFDARFFMAEANGLSTDPDDFSNAEDELSHLHWVPLTEVRALDLPFITEVVLAEVTAHLKQDNAPDTVPFFRNENVAHSVTQITGKPPLGD